MASTSKVTAEAQAPPPPAPNPALILFARGVIARLELWPALRIAVEQGWGQGPAGGPSSSSSSREKRLWLASEIVDAFDNNNDNDGDGDSSPARARAPDAEYVALMLAQVLEDEFDATFEDGSVEAVAGDIVKLWGAGEDVVGMWERKAEGVRGKKVDVREEVGSDEDGDEDEWEDEESGEEGEEGAPQLLPAGAAAEVHRPAKPRPIIDEDGFTLVQKGR
jgi:pre-rRNA-processing protein TSR2